MIVGVAITNGVVTVKLPKPNRHCDCFKYLIEDMGLNPDSGFHGKGQGFYTHTGRYLDRDQAWKYAKRIKQETMGEPRGPMFSEDLW